MPSPMPNHITMMGSSAATGAERKRVHQGRQHGIHLGRRTHQNAHGNADNHHQQGSRRHAPHRPHRRHGQLALAFVPTQVEQTPRPPTRAKATGSCSAAAGRQHGPQQMTTPRTLAKPSRRLRRWRPGCGRGSRNPCAFSVPYLPNTARRVDRLSARHSSRSQVSAGRVGLIAERRLEP
jgi:hypothetical protein